MCPPWKFDHAGYKQQEPYAYPFDKPEAQQHFLFVPLLLL